MTREPYWDRVQQLCPPLSAPPPPPSTPAASCADLRRGRGSAASSVSPQLPSSPSYGHASPMARRFSPKDMAEMRGLLQENGRLLQEMSQSPSRDSRRSVSVSGPAPPLPTPVAEPDVHQPPQCFRVVCPAETGCSGLYMLLQMRYNRAPVWGCGEQRLFASDSGLWMLSNSAADVPLSSGFVCSAEAYGSRWPHELFEWQVFDGAAWTPLGTPQVSVARVEPIHVRPARAADVDFLAWVVAAAEKGHLSGASPIDSCLPRLRPEERTQLLKDVIVPRSRGGKHSASHDGFLVAQDAEENAVGAVCCYPSNERTCEGFFHALAAELDDQGRAADAETLRLVRASIAPACQSQPVGAPTWCIEFVAVKEKHRRNGTAVQLLRAALQEGRQQGYRLAEISCMAGNHAAMRLHQSVGFREHCTVSCPGWREHVACPGVVHLRMDL
eukprot:TRINITY_DN21774_c0_g1_i1.p1 TRINITY_DN21774_c0_g1~~TRINITY_DN21774_c0_g1_i1.p1  ORF type:complete len:442 (+),score=127.01 TRINITY_DN21774_c0_g1_i1:46-1371(+)